MCVYITVTIAIIRVVTTTVDILFLVVLNSLQLPPPLPGHRSAGAIFDTGNKKPEQPSRAKMGQRSGQFQEYSAQYQQQY